MRKIIFVIIIIIVLAAIGAGFWYFRQNTSPSQTACSMIAKLCSDGSYVSRTGPNCEFTPCPKEDLIQVDSPRANETVASPLTITGQARGNWFFEATFPIILADWDGKIIAQGHATALSEWTITDFVPFSATLEFTAPKPIKGVVNRGFLILKKDNPSGLPQYDDSLEIPVLFK